MKRRLIGRERRRKKRRRKRRRLKGRSPDARKRANHAEGNTGPASVQIVRAPYQWRIRKACIKLPIGSQIAACKLAYQDSEDLHCPSASFGFWLDLLMSKERALAAAGYPVGGLLFAGAHEFKKRFVRIQEDEGRTLKRLQRRLLIEELFRVSREKNSKKKPSINFPAKSFSESHKLVFRVYERAFQRRTKKLARSNLILCQALSYCLVALTGSIPTIRPRLSMPLLGSTKISRGPRKGFLPEGRSIFL
jgi:hypothetical protein